MNVLIMGARVIGVALARELVENYMRAAFTNEERHARRLRKVVSIEERYGRRKAAIG
jgi:ribose 5-phosphate isomerase B